MLEQIFGGKDDFDNTLKKLNKTISRLDVVKQDCNNAVESGNIDRADQHITKIAELYDEFNELSVHYLEFLANQADPQNGLDEVENLMEVNKNTETFFYSFELDVTDAIAQNLLNMETYKGLFLFQLGKYRRALKSFDTILDTDDSRDGVWVLKGKTLVELGKNDEALEAFESAISTEWHNADAWVGKGKILDALEDYPAAVEAFDTALEIDENDIDAHLGKAIALAESGDDVNAANALEQAYEIAPDNPEIIIVKAIFLMQSKKPHEDTTGYHNRIREGIGIVDNFISANENFALLWYLKSRAHEEIGESQKAHSAMNRSLKLNPDIERDPTVQNFFNSTGAFQLLSCVRPSEQKDTWSAKEKSPKETQPSKPATQNPGKKVFKKPLDKKKEGSKSKGFACVAGMLELKEILTRDVIKPLQNPENYKKFNVTIPNGILLYGPPGCGKTFIVEKLAEEVGYNFINVPPSKIGSKFIHETSDNIAKVFTEAKDNAPTILFFDEFEALVPRRESLGAEGQFKNEEINEFLTHLNNASNHGILVVGATNQVNLIDSAVMRAGRMDKVILVPPPDPEARKELFRSKLSKVPQSDDIDYAKLAELTDCYSSSDITAIVESAGRFAGDQELDEINMDLMMHVIENQKPSISKSQIKSYEEFRHLERK